MLLLAFGLEKTVRAMLLIRSRAWILDERGPKIAEAGPSESVDGSDRLTLPQPNAHSSERRRRSPKTEAGDVSVLLFLPQTILMDEISRTFLSGIKLPLDIRRLLMW